MPPESRKLRLARWLEERSPTLVELADFEELLRVLAPVNESTLRGLLRESGATLHPLVEGVDQSGFPALARTLLALASAYEAAGAAERRLIRGIVITAKVHAKLAARNSKVKEQKREEKAEMALWMLTWLENPGAFPLWVPMRARSLKLDGLDLDDVALPQTGDLRL